VVESETTRVHNQAMALNAIIAKNTHRIKPFRSLNGQLCEVSYGGLFKRI
jgi:hypothetical protein